MRARRPPASLVAVLVAGAACLRDTASYSPERDDAAMRAIASEFAEAGTPALALSLCEDVAASRGFTPECRYQHVVQGDGRGLAHEESHSEIGCGGCLFRVVAFVVGTVSGGPFVAPASVRGTVTLQSGHDEDPYGFPWGLDLRCEDPAAPCVVTGALRPGGALELTVSLTDGAGVTLSRTDHALSRAGAATCAAPAP
jgi:hypothetical protein